MTPIGIPVHPNIPMEFLWIPVAPKQRSQLRPESVGFVCLLRFLQNYNQLCGSLTEFFWISIPLDSCRILVDSYRTPYN